MISSSCCLQQSRTRETALRGFLNIVRTLCGSTLQRALAKSMNTGSPDGVMMMLGERISVCPTPSLLKAWTPSKTFLYWCTMVESKTQK